MGIFGDMINYIIDMGASAMLPLVIAILSIIVGVKCGKAVRAGLMGGVGFVGFGLIVDMMNANLGPAAQQMSKNFGLSMSVVDLGRPGMSPITWASSIATVAIPVAILVNIIMLVLKLTKTVNIDIWNIWHMTFTGAIAYAVTGNFAIGIGGVVVHAIIAYKFGDLYAPLMEDYFELDGITVPHGTGTWMAPFAFAIDAIIEKIPGLNKIDFSIDNLQEKVGVLAEPIVIGGILGAIVGALAGYDFSAAFQLGIKMSAVMVLMPKITKCIIGEGSEIYGEVTNSVIGSGVVIEEGAVVKDSIIMQDSVIGKGAVVEKSIIAEDVKVGAGAHLGVGEYAPSKYDQKVYQFDLVTVGEHSVIPENVKIGKNTAISGATAAEDYPNGELESGGYIIKAGGVR